MPTQKPTPESLAARGFYLFPCKGKTPLVKWLKESTTDTARIQQWAERYPDCNWGIDCGKSNLAVLDVDSGKVAEAEDNLLGLLMQHGPIPNTFTVRTQSHGLHYYFSGAVKNSASTKLGNGLDTRGSGGYVVAPCSQNYSIETDAPVAPVPEWLAVLVGTPTQKKEQQAPANVKLDTAEALLRAKAYLDKAPPSIERAGGDPQAYKVACKVRDFGVSKEKCLDLMLQHWDARNSPPWGEELASKVDHAFLYAENPQGAIDPKTVFGEFNDDTPPPQIKKSMFIDATELMSRPITIDYLIHPMVETPATGLMFGESTAGKSFLAIAMAMAVATESNWLGNIAKRGSVFYLAGEGQKGIPRRLKAWAKYHNIAPQEGWLHISRSRIELDSDSAVRIVKEVNEMALTAGKPELIIIDTLARHIPQDADENSAKDIGAFINAVDYLKEAFKCVVLVIHHSGKTNKNSGRGSSALKAAMDFEICVRPGIVEFTKQKDGELPAPFGFALVDQEVDPGITSAVAIQKALDPTVGVRLNKDAENAFKILRMMQSEKNGPTNLEDWKQAFYEEEKAKRGVSSQATRNTNFNRAKKELLGLDKKGKKTGRALIEIIDENVFDISLRGGEEDD